MKTTLIQKISLIFLGLALSVILLESGLRLSGAAFFYLQERSNKISLQGDSEYRILCLGESTTALGGEYAYPFLLEETLNERSRKIKFKIINKGLPAKDSGDIAAQLEANLAKYKPQAVIVMMGINDDKYDGLAGQDRKAPIRSLAGDLRVYKLAKLLALHVSHKIRFGFKTRPKQYSDIPEDVVPVKEIAVIRFQITQITKNHQLIQEIKKAYEKRGNLAGVEKAQEQEQKLNLALGDLYSELGRWHREREEFLQSESAYQKAIEISPQDAVAYAGLGRCYKVQRKFDQAITVFEKAIALDPELFWARLELGRCNNEVGNHEKAIVVYRDLLKIDPNNFWAYGEMGQWLKIQGQNAQAKEAFLRSLEINPQNHWVYQQLGSLYEEEQQYAKAESLYLKAIALNPKDVRLYEYLIRCYERQGKSDLAKEYAEKSKVTSSRTYNSFTVKHYLDIVDRILRSRVKLICMQYPLRDILPLKEMLGQKRNIIFVENKEVFEKALKTGRYDEYFVDQFAGDFGHCTRKGNQLIADRLADVILEKLAQ